MHFRIFLFLFLTVSAGFPAHVAFDLADFTTGDIRQRRVNVVPQSTPRTNTTSIVTSDAISFITRTNGTYTLSNMVDGVYRCDVIGPATTTSFLINVPDTNIVINAKDILTASNSIPGTTFGYTMSQADGRFVKIVNGIASNLWLRTTAQTNVFVHTNSSPGYFLTTDGSNAFWAVGGGGGGGNNGANLSPGVGLFRELSGVNLQFKSLLTNQFQTNTTTAWLKDGAAVTQLVHQGLMRFTSADLGVDSAAVFDAGGRLTNMPFVSSLDMLTLFGINQSLTIQEQLNAKFTGTNANTLHVRKDGNDTTAIRGSALFAFATLSNAVAKVQNGDTILIGPGDYVQNLVSNEYTHILSAKTNVTIRGIDQPTIWFTNIAFGFGFRIQSCDGIKISGLRLMGRRPTITGSTVTQGSGIQLGETNRNISIQYCEFIGWAGHAIHQSDAFKGYLTNAQVRFNYFTRCGDNNTSIGTDGAACDLSGTDYFFVNNAVIDTARGFELHANANQVPSQNIVCSGNFFIGVWNEAVLLRHFEGSTQYNNILFEGNIIQGWRTNITSGHLGMWIGNSRNVTIRGGAISDIAGVSTGVGIYVNPTRDIINCTIDAVSLHDIEANAIYSEPAGPGAFCYNVTVNNCAIRTVGNIGILGDGQGLYITGNKISNTGTNSGNGAVYLRQLYTINTNVVVSGNDFFDLPDLGQTTDVAIEVTAGLTNVVVERNRVWGPITPISDSGTRTLINDFVATNIPTTVVRSMVIDPDGWFEQSVTNPAIRFFASGISNWLFAVPGVPTNGQVATYSASNKRFEWAVPPGSGGGEANDGANLGSGVGIYRDKPSVTLQFKSLSGANGITVHSNATDIVISNTVSGGGSGSIVGGTNILGTSTDKGVFIATNNNKLEFKTFIATQFDTNLTNIWIKDGVNLTNTILQVSTVLSNGTASRALILNALKQITNSTVTDTELSFLSGVTSGVQGQLNGKVNVFNGASTNLTNFGALIIPTYVPPSGIVIGTNSSYWTNVAGNITLTISNLPIDQVVSLWLTNGGQNTVGFNLLASAWALNGGAEPAATTNGVTLYRFWRNPDGFTNAVASHPPVLISAGSNITIDTNSQSQITINASGGAGGDSITVNGNAMTDANFTNDVTVIPANAIGISWQTNGSRIVGSFLYNANQLALAGPTNTISIKDGLLLTNAQVRAMVVWTNLVLTNATASRVAVINAANSLTNSAGVDLTELEYLDGVTSAIQTQFGNKVDELNGVATNLTLWGTNIFQIDAATTNAVTDADGEAIWDRNGWDDAAVTNVLFRIFGAGLTNWVDTFNTAPSDGQIRKYSATNKRMEWAADSTGAGGGDALSVNGSATTDPNISYGAVNVAPTNAVKMAWTNGNTAVSGYLLFNPLQFTNYDGVLYIKDRANITNANLIGNTIVSNASAVDTVAYIGSLRHLTNLSTVDVTELGYLDGVTSAIQAQLGEKLDKDVGNVGTGLQIFSTTAPDSLFLYSAHSDQFATNGQTITIKSQANLTNINLFGNNILTNATASRVAIIDSAKRITNSAGVDTTELEYVDGVTSALQTQISGHMHGGIMTNQVNVGAATNLNFVQGQGITLNATNATGNGGTNFVFIAVQGRYDQVWLDAASFLTNTTDSATPGTKENATTRIAYDYLTFANSASNSAQVKLMMPDDWDLGTVKFKVIWATTNQIANSTNVWGLSAVAVSNDDSVTNATWGTEVKVVSHNSVNAAEDAISKTSGAVTVGGTPALGDVVWIRIRRLTADADDQLNGETRLLGLGMQYFRNPTPASLW